MDAQGYIDRLVQFYQSMKAYSTTLMVECQFMMFGVNNLKVDSMFQKREVDFQFLRDHQMVFCQQQSERDFFSNSGFFKEEVIVGLSPEPVDNDRIFSKQDRLTVASPPAFDLVLLIPQLLVYDQSRQYFCLNNRTSKLLYIGDRPVLRTVVLKKGCVNTLELCFGDDYQLDYAVFTSQQGSEMMNSAESVFTKMYPEMSGKIKNKYDGWMIGSFTIQKLTICSS